jgi:hypothetical protein
MLREPDMEIHRSFRSRVANIVEDSLHPSVAVSAVVAGWAGSPFVVTAAFDDLRLGKVLNARDPLCSIPLVFSGCGHLSSLQAKNFFSPERIGRKRPSA